MIGIKALIITSLITFTVAESVCPVDRIPIPDSKDCTKYYDCTSGSPVSKSCPNGEYFNCFNQACGTVLPWLTCCLEDPDQPTEVNYYCNIEGVKIEDAFYCGLYFECVNGEVFSEQCSYGQDFSSYNHSCYDTTIGDCAPTTIPPSVTSEATTSSAVSTTTATSKPSPTSIKTTTTITTTTTSSSSTASTSSPNKCTNAKKIQNINNCRQYYQCQNGTISLQSCPYSQYFNCWTSSCDSSPNSCCSFKHPMLSSCPENGAKIGHPNFCGKYFECVNQMIRKKKCRSRQRFDAWRKTCVDFSEANCLGASQLDVCPSFLKKISFIGRVINKIKKC